MNRLDAIKARTELASANSAQSTTVGGFMYQTQVKSASDVPALVAAVEAVLALRPIANTYRTLDEWEEGYNEALDQAKHKIRTALGGESDA